MCHHITSTVDANTNLNELNSVLSRYGMEFKQVVNPFLEDQLPQNAFYGTLTQGRCDCNTVLGSKNKSVETFQVSPAKLKKLKNKGWSEDRINAWVEGKREGIEHAIEINKDSIYDEVSEWLSMLSAVLQTSLSENIGLLKHWYSGHLEEERFNVSIMKTPIEQVNPDFLLNISEDILYLFY